MNMLFQKAAREGGGVERETENRIRVNVFKSALAEHLVLVCMRGVSDISAPQNHASTPNPTLTHQPKN
jgi:hypothetical protein